VGGGGQRKAARRAGRFQDGGPLVNDGTLMQLQMKKMNRSGVVVKRACKDQEP